MKLTASEKEYARILAAIERIDKATERRVAAVREKGEESKRPLVLSLEAVASDIRSATRTGENIERARDLLRGEQSDA